MAKNDFHIWLLKILDDRGLKPVELARLARIDPSMITRILNAERTPTPKTLDSIATALKLPPETVFRAAGLLPMKPETNEKIDQINHLIAGRSEEELEDYLTYINMRIKVAEERADYKTAKKQDNHPVEESN